jgi:hypothetical protein
MLVSSHQSLAPLPRSSRLPTGLKIYSVQECVVAGTAQFISLPTGWTVLGSHPSGGQTFPYPSKLVTEDPPSLLSNGYQVSFWCVCVRACAKHPWHGDYNPHPPSAKVKERVELCLNAPSLPTWHVIK